MSIRSDLSIRTVALGTSRKNLRTLNQNLYLRRPKTLLRLIRRTRAKTDPMLKSIGETGEIGIVRVVLARAY